MRLLIHGINYVPELTGIGRYTGEMGAWLASRGHEVTVLTGFPFYPEWRVHSAYQGRKWLRESQNGVEVLRAPFHVPAKVTGKKRLLHELSFGASCLYWWPRIFQRRWDAVIAICPPLQMGLVPSLLAKRQEIPFIFHFQDLQVDAARELGILRQPALFAFLEQVEKFLLGRAQMVTTISANMAARLQEKGVITSRLQLFPNWADLEGIRILPRDNKLRRELGFSSEILVLYAGSMGEKHGLEIILASAQLTRKRPDIYYLLAGEGVAKERLMAMAKSQDLDNLLFLPLQSEKRLPFLLAAGDIHLVIQKQKVADLVMPSKLTNILAAGRPFIATALPGTGLGRVTADSQAGLLIPPEDGEALSQAILTLAVSEKVRDRMGERARRYAEAFLDREVILSRLEDKLREITANKRSLAVLAKN
jgi:colanic acid biosynthesis glycosyl transferase WcaI